MDSISSLLYWCPDLLPPNFPGLPKHVYVDNGDRGMTYIAQLNTDSGSIDFQMRRINPGDRYPQMNRRRPLWGDGFDPKEGDTKGSLEFQAVMGSQKFPFKVTENLNSHTQSHENGKQNEPNGKKRSRGKKNGKQNSSAAHKNQNKHPRSNGFKNAMVSKRNHFTVNGVVEDHPKYRTQVCFNNTMGACKFGDKCSFIHNDLTVCPF